MAPEYNFDPAPSVGAHRSNTAQEHMEEPQYYMEPGKNSIPSKNSRCFEFCFPKRFCHCCCCSIQVGLIQSQVFFLLCGIFSIVIGYLHTTNMVMGSIMIVLAVMALFATVWKSFILAPLGITIAVIGIVNTVSILLAPLINLIITHHITCDSRKFPIKCL